MFQNISIYKHKKGLTKMKNLQNQYLTEKYECLKFVKKNNGEVMLNL